jgi:hypothetical protein
VQLVKRGKSVNPLDEHGLHQRDGKGWTPVELKTFLLRDCFKWQSSFDVVISENEEFLGACMLSCKKCKEEYSTVNPEMAAKQHGASCKKQEKKSVRSGWMALTIWMALTMYGLLACQNVCHLVCACCWLLWTTYVAMH